MKRSELAVDAPVSRITDWRHLFEQLRRRPGFWLGSPSLASLEGLVNGIEFAEFLYEVPNERRLCGFPFGEFETWAERQFNPKRLPLNSFALARRSSGSEVEAFYKWFGWYDRFQTEHGTR